MNDTYDGPRTGPATSGNVKTAIEPPMSELSNRVGELVKQAEELCGRAEQLVVRMFGPYPDENDPRPPEPEPLIPLLNHRLTRVHLDIAATLRALDRLSAGL